MVEAERDVLAEAVRSHQGLSATEVSTDELETLRKVAALEAAFKQQHVGDQALTGTDFLQRLFAMWRGELAGSDASSSARARRDSAWEDHEEELMERLQQAFFTLDSEGVAELRDALREGRRRADVATLRGHLTRRLR